MFRTIKLAKWSRLLLLTQDLNHFLVAGTTTTFLVELYRCIVMGGVNMGLLDLAMTIGDNTSGLQCEA